MKKNKQILNVDFIGGIGSMTIAEEKSLSEYFRITKLETTTKQKTSQTKQSKENLQKFKTLRSNMHLENG